MEEHDLGQVVVVANGEFPPPARLRPILQAAERIVAADGGANWLVAQGLRADLLVGDLDSATPAAVAALEAAGCRVQRYPTHKDETDLELALQAAAAGQPRRIVIIGAGGGRIDHALANILLLALPDLAGIATWLFDGQSYLTLLQAMDGPAEAALDGRPGDLLSLIPMGGDAVGIATAGLEYPLRDETLYFGPARGVSNVFLGSRAGVRLRQGRLLLIHTPLDEEARHG